MKIFFKAIGALLIAPAFLLAFTKPAERVNLSGDWKLNEGKSELGEFGGRFTARSIKIEQKEDAITIAKTAPSFQGGETTTTETLTFDGKVSESTSFGNSIKKSVASWSEDGQTLTITFSIMFERNGQTSEFKGTDTWTLKDGSLSVLSVSSSSRGDITTKSVYDKG